MFEKQWAPAAVVLLALAPTAHAAEPEAAPQLGALLTAVGCWEGRGEVMGKPAMSVFGYTSRSLDVFAIADGLEARGWLVSRDSHPVRSIRFMQSAGHEPFVDAYLADLRDVAELVRSGQLTSDRGQATYT